MFDVLHSAEVIIPTLSFKFPYGVEDFAKHLYFENYHCHKDFSNTLIADSGEPIENYAKRCIELGAKCLFSGEHGTQGNQFHVYNVAERNHLRYRHSTEAYWVKDRLAEIQTGVNKDGQPTFARDRTNCHIVIVAKNPEGRRDINFALSMANIDGYYYRPRIDLSLLFDIPKDNVIVTSACIAGWLYPDADDLWLKIHEHFGENFFFEVQANYTDEQRRINEHILELSDRHGIDIIAGLDSHYINSVGMVKREQILKYKDVSYPEETGWYMDYPDAVTLLRRFDEQGVLSQEQSLRALMNTNIFVDGCEEIVFDRSFKIPSLYKDKSYEEKVIIFKNILNKAYKKEKIKSKEKVEGIRYEAEQIIDSGIVDYFLTSRAIVRDAVKNEGGILTTTARGSASSFIINKLLGLTTVDRFGTEVPLIPERFLTKDRVMAGMMPDEDLNISSQEPFVKAAKKIVGEEGCYPLMAVEKLKVKAAWQLYASVNDVSPSDANQISKYIDEYEKKLKHADDDEKEEIHVEDFIPSEYIELFKRSNEYQGITINLKVHACGHILLDGDIRKEIGLISAVSRTTGKRTLCACVEGKVLDDFGFVKEDFLIVDTVTLTFECFKAIGLERPSFDELREMVKNDKPTWDIYANGITCCVNQCEKESTIQKLKRYKPQSVAELCAFIAAIRPGFVSLLNTFLNREPYSTGEPEIDKLLLEKSETTFLLYQESLMHVLNYLGLEMGETYKVIKNISKKKYVEHPEELKRLKKILITSWKEKIGNTDNFDEVWEVIESSSLYSFNSSHSLCVCGDSLYLAWFKAHHTAIFYEVAIKHYQAKDDKKKINALIKEMINFYGYRYGDYRFGNDNRTVNIDAEKKIIYPNLSSIKTFGEKVAEDLYRIGLYKSEYHSFVDVLVVIRTTSINRTVFGKLIKIDYFSEYGSVKKLLRIVELFDLLYEKKEIMKEKVISNGISLDIVKKYGNETAKKINKIIDSAALLNELINFIPDEEITPEEHLRNELEIFGIVSTIIPNYSKRRFLITEIDKKKTLSILSLYEIFSGRTVEAKIWQSQISPEKELAVGLIININDLERKNKREPTGEVNANGKKIYRDIPDKFEFWLKSYYIVE